MVTHFTASDIGAEPRGKKERPSEKSAAKSDGDLLERIETLEGQLSTLRRQTQARQRLSQLAESLGADDAQEGEAAGKPKRADSEDPVFELAVRSVMDRVEWEKDEERKVVRAKRHDDRARRQTSLLTERLGLTSEQADAVATALIRQMEDFRAIRERSDDPDATRPATRSEWRERIGEIRKKTELALSQVLTEEQMKQYLAVAEEEGIGARGWGPGRRGRDGTARGQEQRAAPSE